MKASLMKLFAKIINGQKPLTIFAKGSIMEIFITFLRHCKKKNCIQIFQSEKKINHRLRTNEWSERRGKTRSKHRRSFIEKHVCWNLFLSFFFFNKFLIQCFPLNISRLLRTPNLKNICEGLP